jgi:hypothetical protein
VVDMSRRRLKTWQEGIADKLIHLLFAGLYRELDRRIRVPCTRGVPGEHARIYPASVPPMANASLMNSHQKRARVSCHDHLTLHHGRAPFLSFFPGC